MGGLGFLFIWGLIWYFGKGGKNKQVHDARSRLGNIYAYLLLLFIVFFMLVALTKNFYFPSVVLVFISPYLLSKEAIKFGWVKVSFHIAKMANINRKSPFAGGLFAGYQATKVIADLEEKQMNLRWLRDKYLNIPSTHKLFSGEVVAYVLIDSALTHPGNNEYLIKRLEIVSNLPGGSIPDPIVLYAVQRMLANVMPSNNWALIMKVVNAWEGTPTKLTNFLKAFHQRYILKKKNTGLIPYFVRSILAFRHTAIKEWGYSNRNFSSSENGLIKDREDALNAIWRKHHQQAEFDEANQNNITEALTNRNQEDFWLGRASALGVNKSGMWAEVSSAVNSNFKVDQMTEEQYEFIDDQHQALNYIAQNVKQKWSSNRYKNSAEESVDWLHFLYTFNKLEINKNEQLSAFTTHSTFLWDAMAGFWNTPKEYRFSYMLAIFCSPYAEECGLDDFKSTIDFITSK